jgi:hypothetical protein
MAAFFTDAPKLDPRELFPCYLPPRGSVYLHGGTFSSARSVAHRFHRLPWTPAFAGATRQMWATRPA